MVMSAAAEDHAPAAVGIELLRGMEDHICFGITLFLEIFRRLIQSYGIFQNGERQIAV